MKLPFVLRKTHEAKLKTTMDGLKCKSKLINSLNSTLSNKLNEINLLENNIDDLEAEIKERVYETLKICGLYGFRNWPISALSFGQKKRVTIASILVFSSSYSITAFFVRKLTSAFSTPSTRLRAF